MTVSYSFSKQERLCSRKAISILFDRGEAFNLYPFRVYWNISDQKLPSPAQLGVTASKKTFKKAVDRNRIKRLTREAWRHKKHILYSRLGDKGIHIQVMLVYTDSRKPSYKLVCRKVEEVVSKLLVLLPD